MSNEATVQRTRLRRVRTWPVLLVILLLAGAAAISLRGADRQTFTAYFTSSQGIYEGDEVRVLGVAVGTVEDIHPTEDGVRVRVSVDDDVPIPADARAAIVSPSLVSSRFIQLAPQYSSGPTMADGATIPLARTAVPVEFDDIKKQLDELAVVLGPTGLNEQGSLSKFVSSTSAALDGQGRNVNATIEQLSATTALLDQGRGDVFATVRNLQQFVSVLASSDQQIRHFASRLDIVSAVLRDSRAALRDALAALRGSVRDVDRFVTRNDDRLTETARRVADLLPTIAASNDDIEQILHVGPTALADLYGSYHAQTNSINAGLISATTNNLRQLVCGAVASAGNDQLARPCVRLLGPLLDGLAGDLPLTTTQVRQLEELLGLSGGGRR